MSNTKNKESMAYKNKLAYIKRKNKELIHVRVSFNPSTECDMIEWLKNKKKATYIKELIWKDMMSD